MSGKTHNETMGIAIVITVAKVARANFIFRIRLPNL